MVCKEKSTAKRCVRRALPSRWCTSASGLGRGVGRERTRCTSSRSSAGTRRRRTPAPRGRRTAASSGCSQADTRWLSLPPLLSGHSTTLGKHRSRIVAVTYSQRQRCVVAVDEDAVSRCVCILKINPRRGTVHTTAALVSRGRSLRNVRAICYGPKSFGEMARTLRRDSELRMYGGEKDRFHHENPRSPPRGRHGVVLHSQLYCVVRHNRGLRLRSDAICRIEESTGLVAPVILTGRDDVVAVAAPRFWWAVGRRSVVLLECHPVCMLSTGERWWDHRNVRDHWLESLSPSLLPGENDAFSRSLQYPVRSLMFSNGGTLYASASNCILEVNIDDGSCQEVHSVPRCMKGSVARCCWVPDKFTESELLERKAPHHADAVSRSMTSSHGHPSDSHGKSNTQIDSKQLSPKPNGAQMAKKAPLLCRFR